MTEQQVQRGFFVQISRQPCKNCGASGQIPEKKCRTCKGSGKGSKREEIRITIPQGINEGEAVRVQGKGRPSNSGGLPGDLIFRIHLRKHSVFERNDLDVYSRIEIDYPTLVLGGDVEVPLISGKDTPRTGRLKVPQGTNINDVLRIQGEGFARKIRGNDVKGDAYYVATIKIPDKVGKKEKELLKQLKEL
ncbi:MAG: DnaJ C-terminal domain-containing protein [Candidatus Kariarchaeaceae archaeon]|jgi:molecular chaperone DnaJ